jgi:hypothetical protein
MEMTEWPHLTTSQVADVIRRNDRKTDMKSYSHWGMFWVGDDWICSQCGEWHSDH